MVRGSLALWERRPEARISLTRALDLFEAAYRASNYSPRTVEWYRERLKVYFGFLERELGREPALADLTVELPPVSIREAGGRQVCRPSLQGLRPRGPFLLLPAQLLPGGAGLLLLAVQGG